MSLKFLFLCAFSAVIFGTESDKVTASDLEVKKISVTLEKLVNFSMKAEVKNEGPEASVQLSYRGLDENGFEIQTFMLVFEDVPTGEKTITESNIMEIDKWNLIKKWELRSVYADIKEEKKEK